MSPQEDIILKTIVKMKLEDIKGKLQEPKFVIQSLTMNLSALSTSTTSPSRQRHLLNHLKNVNSTHFLAVGGQKFGSRCGAQPNVCHTPLEE
jgi:hypothetical protein